MLIACCVASATPARAQRVRGTLRDSASGLAIGGGVVWLTDSTGRFLARSIADSAGHFAVMRLDGSAQLHVVRIGYHPRDIRLVVAPTDTAVDVHLSALPLTLGLVEASRRRVCRGDQGTQQALDLWEQARAGLLASVVAREAGAPSIHLLSYSRRLSIFSSASAKLAVKSRSLVADRSYVAGRPASIFVSDGYMHEEIGGDRTFFAPDEQVLIDPTFADTHCLHVVAGTASHAGEIGIGFDPVSGRDTLVDITGVLWLGRTTPELRSLEFHYTALESDAKESGGELIFGVMPNGAPMIVRWMIRSALLTVDQPIRPSLVRRRPPDRWTRHDVRLMGYREVGGVIESAQWADGKVYHASLPRLAGTVFTLSGDPVSGAKVWIDDTPDTVTTDSSGRFALNTVIPGFYVVNASEAALASVGVSLGAMFAKAIDGRTTQLSVYLMPLRSVAGARCSDQPVVPGSSISFGRVIDTDGRAVTTAHVVATFTPVSNSGAAPADPVKRTVETDADGRFSICGGAVGQSLHLRATSPSGDADADVAPKAQLTAVTLIVRPGSGD